MYVTFEDGIPLSVIYKDIESRPIMITIPMIYSHYENNNIYGISMLASGVNDDFNNWHRLANFEVIIIYNK